jgi:uncharacterized integral membrane protein
MKIITRLLFALFVLLGMLIAVSNRQPVDLGLWPLPQVATLPLYLALVVVLLLGILAGLGLGWWAGRHYRRRAREHRREADRLGREVERLCEAVAAHRPAAVPVAAGSDLAPREQRAIARQSALVAPELMPSGPRSASA